MDFGSNVSGRGRGTTKSTHDAKENPARSVSRYSISTVTDVSQDTFPQEAGSVRSQKTSCSGANYRTILQDARIHIEPRSIPKEIQAQINAVIEASVSLERREQVALLAGRLCDDFRHLLGGAAGEDDCIELLFKALDVMDPRRMLKLPRKAGINL